jgi:hypothetical protein
VKKHWYKVGATLSKLLSCLSADHDRYRICIMPSLEKTRWVFVRPRARLVLRLMRPC